MFSCSWVFHRVPKSHMGVKGNDAKIIASGGEPAGSAEAYGELAFLHADMAFRFFHR